MIGLGLSAADQAAYVRGLASSHQLRIGIQVYDLSHRLQSQVGPLLLGGQVTVDTTRDITRSASVELLDHQGVLPFDSFAPSDGALFMDRMLRITYGVRSVDHFDQWVDVPIFTGPITKLSRNGPVVSVECLGKEIIAQRPAWRTKNYGIGTRRSNIIRELLAETGETKFALDEWTLRTAHLYGVTRETDVWTLAKRMAAGRLLYYNGNGTLVLRASMARPVHTFRTGPGGTVVTQPQIDYQTDNFANIVWVVGGTPKGKKYPVQFTAYAPASHPMSAQSLGRNGKSWHHPEKIEDSDLLKESDCKTRAQAELTERLRMSVAVAFDAVPAPFLEEHDAVTIQTTDFSHTFGLDQFTIPLEAGQAASIGYVERRTANKAKIRRTKR